MAEREEREQPQQQPQQAAVAAAAASITSAAGVVRGTGECYKRNVSDEVRRGGGKTGGAWWEDRRAEDEDVGVGLGLGLGAGERAGPSTGAHPPGAWGCGSAQGQRRP